MEKSNIVFAQGLSVKAPSPEAKEFVEMKLSFKKAEFIAFLGQQSGEWVNVDVKKSKEKGTLYAQLNTWKPDGSVKKAPSQADTDFDTTDTIEYPDGDQATLIQTTDEPNPEDIPF